MKKGMNQTLTLIVAASVLMMTALTVIFLATDTIGPTTESVDVTSCRSLSQQKCSDETSTIQAPSSCTDDEGKAPSKIVNQVKGVDEGGNLDCSQYQ